MSGNRKSEKFGKQGLLKWYECGEYGHMKSPCPKAIREGSSLIRNGGERKSTDTHIARAHSNVSNKKVPIKEITLGNITAFALLIQRVQYELLRENMYKQDVGLPNLLCNPLILSGIGQAEVMTRLSFEQDVEIHGFNIL